MVRSKSNSFRDLYSHKMNKTKGRYLSHQISHQNSVKGISWPLLKVRCNHDSAVLTLYNTYLSSPDIILRQLLHRKSGRNISGQRDIWTEIQPYPSVHIVQSLGPHKQHQKPMCRKLIQAPNHSSQENPKTSVWSRHLFKNQLHQCCSQWEEYLIWLSKYKHLVPSHIPPGIQLFALRVQLLLYSSA